MAKTIRTYTSNGIQSVYPIDFTLGYLDNRDYVFVYSGSDHTSELAYTWVDDAQIELNPVPADGVEFYIRRVVPRDDVVNNYADGANLRERELDQSFLQAVMLFEEVEDGYMAVVPPWVIQGDIDMNGGAILNLGAVQAESILDDGGNDILQDTIDARDAAQASEIAAGISETNAGTSETNAAQSAVDAAAALSGLDGRVSTAETDIAALENRIITRNKLINGDFGIWERGVAFTGSEYTADRWETVASGNTQSVSRANFPLGAGETLPETNFYLRYTRSTTVSTNTFLQQKIRGVHNVAGRSYTLSFYVRASAAAEIRVGFNQNFGVGGSATVFFGTTDVAVSPSWQKKTLTITAPSISGKTLGTRDYATLQFQLLSGEGNGDVDLALIQLEDGLFDTTFDVRLRSEQLDACRRFHIRWVSDANSTSTYLGSGLVLSATETRYFLPLPIEMDTVPALLVSDFADFQSVDNGITRDINTLTISSSQSDTKHIALAGTLASGGITGQAAVLRFDATSGRYLALDAEL